MIILLFINKLKKKVNTNLKKKFIKIKKNYKKKIYL